MTPGPLIAYLRAVGAKLDAHGPVVWPAGDSEADRFFLSNGVKRHRDAVAARADRIPPDDLVKWMRAWHREQFRPTETCQRCGSAIDCWLLVRTCRNCIAKET